MTCRHSAGDPNCSSTRGIAPWGSTRFFEEAARKEVEARFPNPDTYKILKVEEVGSNVVLLVKYTKYTSCPKCNFDANKVLVFEKTSLKDVVLWKRIDPHFAPRQEDRPAKNAPAPRARFPADEEGWADALHYAETKGKK